MKRLLVLMTTSLLALGTVSAQQQPAKADTAKFMNHYRQFVDSLEAVPTLAKPQADSIIHHFDSLTHVYRSLKPSLSDLQVREYNELKGRYTKRMIRYRSDRFVDGLEATGDSIQSRSGRLGQAVGGFFQGLFGGKK